MRNIIPAEELSASLPRVDADEIAFAMALFVSAANGRIHGANIGASGFPIEENLYELIDAELPAEEETLAGTPSLAALSRAISVLWHHYKGDERQRTIWCRVAAFHAMMAKTRGSVVQRWMMKHDNAPLHAAVANAVAEAPLCEFGQFDPLEFVRCAERFDNQAALVPPADVRLSIVSRLPVSRAGALLCSLRGPLTVVTGSIGVQALISRAINTNSASYPWLKDAELTSDGILVVERLSDGKPSAEDFAEGEAAVTSSLLKSLTSLVGEGVAAGVLSGVLAGDVAHA